MVHERPFFWIKQGGSLCPSDAHTEEFVSKLNDGDMVRTKRPTKPRSLPFHNRYWGKLAVVVKATECAASVDHLHDFLVKATGYRTAIFDANGKPVDTVRDSTAWAKMDEIEFQQYEKSADRCMGESLGIDAEALCAARWKDLA